MSKPRALPTHIDWAAHADGEWWLAREGHIREPIADRGRAYERIKQSAGRWARANGYDRNVRRRELGRLIWVRFTKPEQVS